MPRSGPPRPTPYATSSYLGSGALSKLPCTMQMSSSSHLGSDALKWAAVTAIRPLRCPSHSARGLHLFTFLHGSPLCLAQQATPTPPPTLMHRGLLHSATPNAMQIFNFEVFSQMPFREALTTNVRAPISLTPSTIVLSLF